MWVSGSAFSATTSRARLASTVTRTGQRLAAVSTTKLTTRSRAQHSNAISTTERQRITALIATIRNTQGTPDIERVHAPIASARCATNLGLNCTTWPTAAVWRKTRLCNTEVTSTATASCKRAPRTCLRPQAWAQSQQHSRPVLHPKDRAPLHKSNYASMTERRGPTARHIRAGTVAPHDAPQAARVKRADTRKATTGATMGAMETEDPNSTTMHTHTHHHTPIHTTVPTYHHP